VLTRRKVLGAFAAAGATVLGGCKEAGRETGGGAVGTVDDSDESAGDASSVKPGSGATSASASTAACEFVSQGGIDRMSAAGKATPE